ncbi:MAG: TlpA family protein disulfide reductase [Bdellovibrionales bacterium]
MGNLVGLLLTFFLAGCGSNLPTTLGGEAKPQPKVEKIEGSVVLTDGSTLDLAGIDQPLVVMFVTYFCISCKEEAAHLSEYFAAKGGLPQNVKLVTILAGGDATKATRWAQKNKVTWTMTFDPSAENFKRLCPEEVTPCVLTRHPKTSIEKHLGIVPVGQLEAETGPWEY